MTPETKDRLVAVVAMWRERSAWIPFPNSGASHRSVEMSGVESCADELEKVLAQMDETPAPAERDEEMSDTRTHSIERTSPKGGPFLGTCRYCSRINLPMSAATEHCPMAPTQDVQIIDTLAAPADARTTEPEESCAACNGTGGIPIGSIAENRTERCEKCDGFGLAAVPAPPVALTKATTNDDLRGLIQHYEDCLAGGDTTITLCCDLYGLLADTRELLSLRDEKDCGERDTSKCRVGGMCWRHGRERDREINMAHQRARWEEQATITRLEDELSALRLRETEARELLKGVTDLVDDAETVLMMAERQGNSQEEKDDIDARVASIEAREDAIRAYLVKGTR